MTALNGENTGKGAVAVMGTSHGEGAIGVFGTGDAVGIRGDGKTWHGVAGFSKSTTGGCGVYGEALVGVMALGTTWNGLHGETHGKDGAAGVLGLGNAGGIGVKGQTSAPNVPAVLGIHLTHGGPGVYGEGAPAGLFKGEVIVTANLSVQGDIVVAGDIKLPGADLAEQFEFVGVTCAEPGTVMVLDGIDQLRVSERAYDRNVAGVIAGAGGYRPGVVLDHRENRANRCALALAGKVYCRVDATHGAIAVGDLLTTSPTPGHAMKASDMNQAFGAVLGKAMAAWNKGTGSIPILVSLH